MTVKIIHPNAKILKEKIENWRRKKWFYKSYFEKNKLVIFRSELSRKIDNKNFMFKAMLEDNYTNEKTVKLLKK